MKIKALKMPDDLLSTYRQLSSLSGFALLKSDDNDSNWDIVTALPYKCQNIAQVENLKSDIIFQSQFNQSSLGPFPFQGGVIGYLSYDYGVLSHHIPMKPYNPYRQLPLARLNWYRWCIAVNHSQKTATLIYDTDTDTVSKLPEIEDRWHQSTEMMQQLGPVRLEALWGKHDYAHAFDIIQQGLRAGRCYQVNLTQPYRFYSSAHPWQLYEQIARSNAVPYGAFLDYNGHQILSFSPECFITIEGPNVITRPIKGSIARSNDNPELDRALADALKGSEKDRAENVMIVDLLRNDLSKIAQKGSVRVNTLCELQSYPQVHHLVSEIAAVKKETYSALDVLLSAFPGGSITGAPKIEAMKMIAELELTNRGPYCGSIFYYSQHGRLDSNIAIRTMIALDDAYWLHAGGGIVIDSQLEQEYEECLVKLSAILNAVNMW